jgi:hypothetical protein
MIQESCRRENTTTRRSLVLLNVLLQRIGKYEARARVYRDTKKSADLNNNHKYYTIIVADDEDKPIKHTPIHNAPFQVHKCLQPPQCYY